MSANGRRHDLALEERNNGVPVTDYVETSKPGLDANKYATKKTIAQGMLDIALLTANASQLKYVLQLGKRHEFYTIMIGLIATSIILQIVVGILALSLNFMRDCRLHLREFETSSTVISYFNLGCVFIITILNILISAFDPVLGAIL